MLDLSKSPVVPTSEKEQTEKRRKLEDYVRNCNLSLPEEVAELFINYTRWIWEYKCIGAINKYYNDATICYTENGGCTVGADPVIAGSLQSICAYPDKINDFVDIIVEGNEEDGYSFGQSSKLGNFNLGWSKYGEATGKWLGVGDVPLYSICELTLKKIDGRWRVTEEWVVEGTEVKRMTLNAEERAEVERNIGIDPDIDCEDCEITTADLVKKAAEAAEAAAKAAEAALEAIKAIEEDKEEK
ncbi:MAG: hypothetical protein ACLSAO_05390 [Anaerovoracaceae bacterium]